MMLLWSLAVILVCLVGLGTSVLNADFEDPLGYDNWYCAGCEADNDLDAYSGNYSMLSVNRAGSWAGPRQRVTDSFELGVTYYISIMVKAKTTEGNDSPMDLSLTMQYKLDGEDVRKYGYIARRNRISPADGWVKLAADYTLDDYGAPIEELQIYVEQVWGTDTTPRQDILLDDFQMRVVNESDDWYLSALERLTEVRTSNLSLVIRGWHGTETLVDATVEIEQLESQFGLGTSVDGFLLTYNDAYRDTFLQNFAWGVLETDMSWRETEYSKNVLTWEAADAGMHILEAHNKRVRGGIVHQSGQGVDYQSTNVPEFLKEVESPDDIYRYSMKRVDDLLGRYRYRCEHWDVVNNMMMDDNFMYKIYGADKIFTDLYKRAKEVDYAAKMFINHDNLLTSSEHIQRVLDMVERFRSVGAPVGGIGVRAVFTEPPSPSLILDRLDRLSEAGVPIWITGYSFSHSDQAIKVKALEDFMLAVGSHPAVEGVMLKDFWDGHTDSDDSALFEGASLTPNAVGMKWQEFYREWTQRNEVVSTFNFGPDQRLDLDPLQLNRGVYKVIVKRADGSLIREQKVPLLKHQGDKMIEIWF